MGYLRIDITYDEDLLTQASHRKILNQLFRESLEHHKQVILPRHFKHVPETTPGGAYGFRKRSDRWLKKKKRMGKPDEPNVFTGGLRSRVLGASKVRATFRRGTLTAKAPWPLTTRRRSELEVVSNREQERMTKKIEKGYVKRANSPEFRRKRRRKIK